MGMITTDERAKMTHYVPEALRRRAKVAAASRGETVTDLVVRALEHELERLEGPQEETQEPVARHTGEDA